MDEALKAALVSLSGQSKSVKSATVEHLCKGLNSVTSPTGAGLITVWLGIAVENGANPRNSVEAVLQCFFKWSQGIVSAGSDKATDMKNDAEVMAGLQLLGQSVVSHLLRMPDLRHHLSHSREILT
jgi:hypothetical protein